MCVGRLSGGVKVFSNLQSVLKAEFQKGCLNAYVTLLAVLVLMKREGICVIKIFLQPTSENIIVSRRNM